MKRRYVIEALQKARLEWGMTCHCTCKECDRFYEAISDIEEMIAAPDVCYCDDHQGTHARCPTHGSQDNTSGVK